MAKSGAVWTANNVAAQLYNQNRDYNNRLTWQTALANNNIAAGAAQSQLIKDYTDASAEAYVSYLRNKNNIENSAIVGQGKQELLSQNDIALQEAYDSYRAQLAEGSAQVAASAQESEAAIQEALQKQAQYTADYANAHWDYLKQLYYDYTQGENTIFDNKLWNKYIVQQPVLDADGNEMHNDKGEIITEPRLMTREELASTMYDGNGNLTMEGVDIYDQIENAVAQSGTGQSWGDYLAENNEELFNWAQSYNPYNYTFEGTNAGTFRTMVGMAADDNQWAFIERYGGMTEEELQSNFEGFYTAIEKLKKIDTEEHADDAVKALQDVNNELWNLAEELGLDGQMEELGISRQTTQDILNQAYDDIYTHGELSSMRAKNILLNTAAGAAAGLAGSGGNPIVALVGGAVGLITGGAVATVEENRMHAHNKQYVNNLKSNYTNMLNNVVNQQLQNRRQAEIDFAVSQGR